jgi:ferredoxin
MAIIITEDCINCNQCEPECPNNAIYEAGVEWALQDGTSIKGEFILQNGTSTNANTKHAPFANHIYYIVPDKCTECQGFHSEPQCAAVCPVDCCVPDEMYKETLAELLVKKNAIHFK